MTRDELEMKKDAALPEENGTDTADMGNAALGGYVNPYAGQIQELYEGISNRQPFQYDVDSDAMYQALKDQYVAGGQLAMMDTMGQATQLTGGYGNSYAQGAGQQAYQGYLQGLNDQLPDLYNMALQNYIQTGNAMLQEYDMLQDMAAQDYGKYQDQMALVQPQVLEMLQAGKRPSEEMLAQSGLSKEYVEAMFPEKGAGSSGAGIDKTSQWYKDYMASLGLDVDENPLPQEDEYDTTPLGIYRDALSLGEKGKEALDVAYDSGLISKDEHKIFSHEYEKYMGRR